MGTRNWYRKKYEREIVLSRHAPEGAFDFVIALDHLKPGFNVGKIFRAANALGAREVHLIGIGVFDPSPAKGAFKQTRTRSFATLKESFMALEAEGYTLFALDPSASALTLGEVTLPEKVAFYMGHEEFGFSEDLEHYPRVKRLKIPQFGDVQSLNVSIAASLAAYEYVRQRGFRATRDKVPHPLLPASLAEPELDAP